MTIKVPTPMAMAVLVGIISYPKSTQITHVPKTAVALWMPVESDWDHAGELVHRPKSTMLCPVAIHDPTTTNVRHSSTQPQTKPTEFCSVREHSTTEWSDSGCDDEIPRFQARFPAGAVAYIPFPGTSRISRRHPSRELPRPRSHRKCFGICVETRGTPAHFREPDWSNHNSSR